MYEGSLKASSWLTLSVSVVLVETAIPHLLFKKFVTTKLKGTLTNQLDDGKYLVEYDTDEGT